MNERDALLRAVCENPDDDTPRLVFADWLQENGEPEYAEFVRLQVRHAELLRYGAPDSHGFAGLARELWLRHGERWRAELPRVSGLTWHDAFFRGFPERALVLSDAVLLANAVVFDRVPVRHLTISEFAAVDGFSQLPCVQRLKTLSLSASDPDGSISRRLIENVRLNPSTLLIVAGGLSGNDKYATLRAAFGDQLYWPFTPSPPTSPPPPPSRRRRQR
ncbi:MAG: TIGR02996 domain-containing protein [Planctomycetes bacterium]|nr:TIGR02996 domain-containing protein [Planctomycetota bacterium]